jgi:hypothetical protein
LFPHLDPKNALDHGHEIEIWDPGQLTLPGLESLSSQRYARSGWPVYLVLIGEEAWRRHASAEISKSELYCSTVQITGTHERNLKLGLTVNEMRKRPAITL